MEKVALRWERTEEGKKLRKQYEKHEIHHGFNEHRVLVPRIDGLCNTLTTVLKDNYILEVNSVECKQIGRITNKWNGYEMLCRVYSTSDLCPTIKTVSGGGGEVKVLDDRVRRLTPREYWRLMGFTDGDFNKAQSVCSNTQLYKQAGNSICVPVLEAIFKSLFKEGK